MDLLAEKWNERANPFGNEYHPKVVTGLRINPGREGH